MRRYYQCCRCGQEQGYAADVLLQCDERLTRLLRSHLCRLSSDGSFAQARDHVQAMLGVGLCAETCRSTCEREARRVVQWERAEPPTSAEAFQAAAGEVEFQTDAAKVHTREAGWKDLKIACFLKRPRGEAATAAQWESRTLPAPTAVEAWSAIAPIGTFRKTWRKKGRHLGITQGAQVHALGDGAAWIWKGLERSLSGCTQTLDLFHAAEKFAWAGQQLYGEGTDAAGACHERGRTLLLEQGWPGVTQWMAEVIQEEDTSRRRRVAEKVLQYFATHASRLDYGQRLQEGRSIGSGAIEGQAKTLGRRLTARGSRWCQRHIKPMTTLIHLRHSPRWHHYWKNHAA